MPLKAPQDPAALPSICIVAMVRVAVKPLAPSDIQTQLEAWFLLEGSRNLWDLLKLARDQVEGQISMIALWPPSQDTECLKPSF